MDNLTTFKSNNWIQGRLCKQGLRADEVTTESFDDSVVKGKLGWEAELKSEEQPLLESLSGAGSTGGQRMSYIVILMGRTGSLLIAYPCYSLIYTEKLATVVHLLCCSSITISFAHLLAPLPCCSVNLSAQLSLRKGLHFWRHYS